MIAGRRIGAPHMAALVALVTFAAYVPQLASGVDIGDSAEAQTVPYVLGLMHPTGFPLYILLGWVWSHALVVGTVAWRFNAFTAACTAICAAGVVLLAGALESGTIAAACAALAFAFGSIVWGGAVVAITQQLSSALSIFALIAALRFARAGSVRALFAACACSGLGLATHPSALWTVPAIAVALGWRRDALRPRLLATAALTLAVPLLLYAYLPLRTAAIVPPAYAGTGAPPLDPASLDWEAAPPQILTASLDRMLGRREHATSALAAAFNPRAYPGALAAWWNIAGAQYHFGLPLLALAGFALVARHDRRGLSVVAAAWAGYVLFAFAYRDDTHLDRYYTVSFAIAAALAAATTRLGALRAGGTVVLLLMAAQAYDHDRPFVPSVTLGERIVATVAHDTPDGAIIIAPWEEASALRYGSHIEGALGSRTIVGAWPWEYARFYGDWTRTRRVILFSGPQDTQDVRYLGAWVHPVPSSFPPYRVLEVSR